MTYGLAWSVLSHCCNFILISPDFLTSEQANLFPPQALCICCSSCLECFQVKYHVLREAFLDPPTPTGVQHSFISVTALLLSKTTVFTYLLTCFFSISCTRTFHHKGRDSIYPPLYSQVLEWCLLQLPPPTQITAQQHCGEGPAATTPGCRTLQLAQESLLLLELLIAATAGNDSPWYWACQSDRLSWGHLPVRHQDFSVEAWSLPHTQAKRMHWITQKVPSGCFSVNILLDFSRGNTLGLPRRLSDKESACNTGDVGSMPELIPWKRKWQPSTVWLPGWSHGQRRLVVYGTWGRRESDTTERLHEHAQTLSWL